MLSETQPSLFVQIDNNHTAELVNQAKLLEQDAIFFPIISVRVRIFAAKLRSLSSSQGEAACADYFATARVDEVLLLRPLPKGPLVVRRSASAGGIRIWKDSKVKVLRLLVIVFH